MSPISIFHCANVVTMDDERRIVEAFAVENWRVIATGDFAELRQSFRDAELVDLGGSTVLPGLIDAHSHLEMLAYTWELATDVRSSAVGSIAEMIERLREVAARTEPGEWIMAHGEHFQDLRFEERRFPDRHDLDRVSREHPIYYRSSYHLNVFNSAALELLGVDETTPDAPGGRIERHPETGELTGRTYDMFAPLGGPQAEAPVLADAMAAAARRYLAVGVTALGEISLHSRGLEAMLLLSSRDDFPLRATVYPTLPNAIDRSDVATLRSRFDGVEPERLRLGGVKLFLDGGLTAGAAALHDDYPDQPGYRGELRYDDAELAELLHDIDREGFQTLMHAIGDRALDQALGAVEALGEGAAEHRHRIEHAGNLWMTPDRISRLVRSGVIPVPQPAFIRTTALGYRARLGDRVGDLMPFRALADAGIRIPGNSDAIGISADQHDPFPAIEAAVTRRSQLGEPVDPQHALTLLESIEMYTRNAAQSIGRETEIGSLEAGKFADFVVLDRDILTVPSDQIATVRPRQTWSGGELVFEP